VYLILVVAFLSLTKIYYHCTELILTFFSSMCVFILVITYYSDRCEIVFTKAILKHRNYKGIADNKALRENIYMMIVCIENKLPLFVIGKPGSSKSLAKAMVSDSMKGKSSYDSLFRELKEVSGSPHGFMLFGF